MYVCILNVREGMVKDKNQPKRNRNKLSCPE